MGFPIFRLTPPARAVEILCPGVGIPAASGHGTGRRSFGGPVGSSAGESPRGPQKQIPITQIPMTLPITITHHHPPHDGPLLDAQLDVCAEAGFQDERFRQPNTAGVVDTNQSGLYHSDSLQRGYRFRCTRIRTAPGVITVKALVSLA